MVVDPYFARPPASATKDVDKSAFSHQPSRFTAKALIVIAVGAVFWAALAAEGEFSGPHNTTNGIIGGFLGTVFGSLALWYGLGAAYLWALSLGVILGRGYLPACDFEPREGAFLCFWLVFIAGTALRVSKLRGSR